jgi:hypothetical protein
MDKHLSELSTWFGSGWYVEGNTIKRDADTLCFCFEEVEEPQHKNSHYLTKFHKVAYFLDGETLLDIGGKPVTFRYKLDYLGYSAIANKIFQKLRKTKLTSTRGLSFESVSECTDWVTRKINAIRAGDINSDHVMSINIEAILPTHIALKVLDMVKQYRID